jgi:cysteine desulfurase
MRPVNPIYLDYNATTPLDRAVADAMEPFLREHFGNPSSAPAYGYVARDAVEHARRQVAGLLGASPSEIIFTSGGSEASNHALKGAVFAALGRSTAPRVRILTTTVEHPATLEPCAFFERLGCSVVRLPVDRYGVVEMDALRDALRRPTLLVSVMHANNEVGTIQPIAEIAQLAHEAGALVHTDAAQSVGKIPVHVAQLGVDLLSVAGHKVYAPKGVGALYIRDGVVIESLIHGAGHEAGRRAGTENVPYAVGFGMACAIAAESLPAATEHLRALRDRLQDQLQAKLGERFVLNGHPDRRLPNTLNANVVGCVGADLLAAIPDIAASTGSACHEGQVQISPVLKAMAVPPQIAAGAVRLSVGRFTTEAEIDRAASLLARAAKAGHGAYATPEHRPT